MTRQGSAEWKTSSYTGEQGNCVEVRLATVVGVRDTKDRSAGYLVTTPGAWTAFLNKVANR
jgi:hypothetical protein